MTRVLFVCLGNICRSPAAEGLFLKHLQQAGRAGEFDVDSAGTGDWHVGDLPDPRMRETAARHSVSLPSRARCIRPEDLIEFDYIVAMDHQNLKDIHAIKERLPSATAQVLLMRDFDLDGKGQDVPDPYFGGHQGFEQVFQILDRSTFSFLQHISQ